MSAIGAARGVSAGNSGGMRRTTRVPWVGPLASDKSPATPAAKESVLSPKAATTTRMRLEAFKPPSVN